MADGYPIVLTADRTLMAGYRLLFDGMLAASQTTTAPAPLLHALMIPPVPVRDGHAVLAPLGLRRVEAALLASGMTAEEVAVVDEAHLADAIGPRTRIVAISAGEPCGRGMNSSTMTAVAGGAIYPQTAFRHLLSRVRKCLAAAPSARVVVGGPGAWQLVSSAAPDGIDHVITGYCEGNVAALVQTILAGEALPRILTGDSVPTASIPRIRGGSTMGVVEISRGCGVGCAFCTLARTPMQHLPVDTILADIRTNVAAGMPDVAALSEDLFRYGARNFHVNPPALLDLLRRMRAAPGVRLIQIDHANIASVAEYADTELRAVHDLLVGDNRHDFLWVNLGVETASGPLLQRAGAGGKLGGIATEDWGEASAEQVRRLCRAGFFPLVSLMLGLPGETEDDVQRTLAWVQALREERIAVFPVLYAPLSGEPTITRDTMTPAHWALIRTSYDFNFRWVPQLFWDNQTAIGVPWSQRAVLQAFGFAQTLLWRSLLAWHARRAAVCR
jgi:radical SAM superfamily enzyme YgiQ (UPF0313 family)